MGLKGIKYVGAVASFMPIIPIVILGFILLKTLPTYQEFDTTKMMAAEDKRIAAAADELPKHFTEVDDFVKANGYSVVADKAKRAEFKELEGQYLAKKQVAEMKPATLYGNPLWGVFSLICAYVIGFFATAGAAGVGICSVVRSRASVQFGGFFGIVVPTIFSGAIALIAVAGAQKLALDAGQTDLLTNYNATQLFALIFSEQYAKPAMFLLAVAAFPSACFCTLIAAECIKTSFPKINPWGSCGVGVAAAIALVVTGYAGKAGDVFTVIGASFGPICGAMAADYILSGFRWAGPREGFNPAGWLSWFFGFIVGGATLVVTKFMGETMPYGIEIPCPPLSAFVVGFVLYIVFASIGLQSKKIDLPQRID